MGYSGDKPKSLQFSSLGQTVITLIGAATFVSIILSFAAIIFPEQRQYRSFDSETLIVLFAFSVLSVSISQPCWIAGARGLGIAIASFHLNAVPFYVMGVLVFIGDGIFDPFKLLWCRSSRAWSFFSSEATRLSKITPSAWVSVWNISKLIDSPWYLSYGNC